MADLDARKRTILQAVVIEYVAAAEPVGSELLATRYRLGVKSATIRNELAEMSELGFLEQPHTSSGRIPSDMGYRFYVDRLITAQEADDTTKLAVKEASEQGDALQSLLRDTSRVLSRVTQLLAVATTVRDSGVTVLNAIVSALGPSKALLVVILSNGHVKNRMIECPPGLTLEDIGGANEFLAANAVAKSLKVLKRAKQPAAAANPTIEKLRSILWSSVRSIARERTRGIVVTEGEQFMFAQPEFQRDLGSLNDLLQTLLDSEVLYEAVSPGEAGKIVTIGRENRNEAMHTLSVVRNSFYVGENEAGVIALVGPTRMSYDTSIPLVNYTARALSDSLTRFFG